MRFSRRAAVVMLLACHALLAVTSVVDKSNTFDELIHLTAGYRYWTAGDYRLQPENGNLPQRWASLPLLFQNLRYPHGDAKLDEDAWLAAQIFFFESGNDADAMLLSGRIMMVALNLVLGLLIFFWAKGLFGYRGALVSLTLFAFSPTLLAHSRLTTSDTASALFFLASTGALWRLMHRADGPTAILAGAATGALLLSKMSGLLAVPVVLAMGAVRLVRGAQRRVGKGAAEGGPHRSAGPAAVSGGLFVAAAVAMTMVWGAYGFRFSAAAQPTTPARLSFSAWSAQLAGAGVAEPVIGFCRDRHLLPEAYLYGLSHVLNKADERMAFMDGRYGDTGWWQFFPYGFAVKTPLGVMLMLALAGLALRCGDGRIDALWPLAIFVAIYGAVAMASTINIGHRHILPLYPALFIFAGASARWFGNRRLPLRLVPVLAMGLFLAESLAIWPHYLAFFNAAAGGPRQGYRRLVDSSLDWGQDLPGLRRWIEDRRGKGDGRSPVYLAYFGSASPAHHRVPARIISVRTMPWMRQIHRFAGNLGPGTYCISATELQQVYGFPGGWRSAYETAYTMASQLAEDVRAAGDDPRAMARLVDIWGGRKKIDHILGQLRLLAFARLCAALKTRAPDDQVGYSIQIYEVSDRELDRALHGPPESWGRSGYSKSP